MFLMKIWKCIQSVRGLLTTVKKLIWKVSYGSRHNSYIINFPTILTNDFESLVKKLSLSFTWDSVMTKFQSLDFYFNFSSHILPIKFLDCSIDSSSTSLVSLYSSLQPRWCHSPSLDCLLFGFPFLPSSTLINSSNSFRKFYPKFFNLF